MAVYALLLHSLLKCPLFPQLMQSCLEMRARAISLLRPGVSLGWGRRLLFLLLRSELEKLVRMAFNSALTIALISSAKERSGDDGFVPASPLSVSCASMLLRPAGRCPPLGSQRGCCPPLLLLLPPRPCDALLRSAVSDRSAASMFC